MRTAVFSLIATAIFIALSTVTPATADPGRCSRCGCTCECQKMCRLVCEEKKIEVCCFACKCEDFCVPGRSCQGCQHCETVCGTCDAGCDPKVPVAKPKTFVWFDWLPSTAKIYTRTKLMKKTDTVKVPSYKWVVVEMCSQCAAECSEPLPELMAEP